MLFAYESGQICSSVIMAKCLIFSQFMIWDLWEHAYKKYQLGHNGLQLLGKKIRSFIQLEASKSRKHEFCPIFQLHNFEQFTMNISSEKNSRVQCITAMNLIKNSILF